MQNNPLVSVALVVKDGEKYIRQCLQAILNQTYANIEVIIFDNCSSDRTLDIAKREFPQFRIIENKKNYFVGGGFNKCLELSRGEFMLALCVDVVIDKDFIKNAVQRMVANNSIGVLQSKTLIYDRKNEKLTNIIDTTGFEIYRSRRIINRGHGIKDTGQYSKPEEIFSYEGACGFFRKSATENAKIDGQIFDEDFIWYADDVDLGWRLNLLGWKNYYDPMVISWHDRSTTHRLSKSYADFINLRKSIPPNKKGWDYANQRLAIIKNDITSQFISDLPFIIFREIKLLIYFVIFERSTLREFGRMLKMIPKMAEKRKKIMAKRKLSDNEIKKWFK